MSHVMLDIETWGLRPGSAIRSIGAVVFDPSTGKLGSKFYRNIDDQSCFDIGLTQDASTVQWWSEQADEAKDAFTASSGHPVAAALSAFSNWFTGVGGVQVYGHGANFDIVLLEVAYAAANVEVPWKFWNVRCCRTILAMADLSPQREGGVHHNALDDAIAQAKSVAAAFCIAQFNPN